jgi:major membrane immunogen (membrane-anchored lipoprotein)
LEDLAMQSDKVLMIDNQTDIFIWSGKETSSNEFNEKRENLLRLAKDLSRNRFPQPVIQQFKVPFC